MQNEVMFRRMVLLVSIALVVLILALVGLSHETTDVAGLLR